MPSNQPIDEQRLLLLESFLQELADNNRGGKIEIFVKMYRDDIGAMRAYRLAAHVPELIAEVRRLRAFSAVT